MGLPIGRNLEDEMMTKIKKLFDKILETVNKDNPTYTFDFEQFVDSFDENDQFTKRVFEFLVKEIAQRYRSTHPISQHASRQRPPTIHHFSSQEGDDSNANSNNIDSNSTVTDSNRASHLNTGSEMDPAPGLSPRVGRPNITHQASEETNGDTANAAGTEADYISAPTGSLPSPAVRRPTRRGDTLERQRAFIFRPRSRISEPTASMENAPESFRAEGWNPSRPRSAFPSESIDGASGELHLARDSRLMEQARQLHEQLRQAQEARQQQVRQLYIQQMQARGRQRGQSSQAHQQQQQQQQQQHQHESNQRQADRINQHHLRALMTLQGQRSPTSEESQDQHNSRYQLRDNGLMLVQLYPSSTSSTPSNNTTADASMDRPLTLSISPASSFGSSLPSDERYHEFRDLTQRGRAVMRNAHSDELQIEEDSQVLLTGEVSRRRRRRVVGRFSSINGPLDIVPDNYSAMANQSLRNEQQGQIQNQRQQQEQLQQPQQSMGISPSTNTENEQLISSPSHEPSSNQQQSVQSLSTTDNNNMPSHSAGGTSTGLTRLSAPSITVGLIGTESEDVEVCSPQSNSASGMNVDHLNPRLSSENTSTDQSDHHQHQIPPTPPSPNPNRNPMPTFQDRRRSSINPADIEAVVREMRANVRSSVSRLGTISSSPDTNSEGRFPSSENSNQTTYQTTESIEVSESSRQTAPSESPSSGHTNNEPRTEANTNDVINNTSESLLGTLPLQEHNL
ncbi:hypothetical protein BGZ76_010491 [Entomortierella beljakovae]|nr:hypothetical protein BGZ76_010491 [Entomortierella beljakovae]